MSGQQITELANQCPKSLRRFMRWAAVIGIVAGIGLPLYNLFLHGPRHAESIISRGSAYFEAHLVGGILALLLMFGLIAIFLAHAKRFGKFGLLAFIIALFAQGAWAAILFVDGIFNPLLGYFDPEIQTHLHSAEFSSTAGENYLATLFGPALHIFNAMSFIYLVGFVMLSIAIFRSNVLPRVIPVLLATGSIPLAFALMLPLWLETVGYAAIGAAIVWSGFLVLRATSATHE